MVLFLYPQIIALIDWFETGTKFVFYNNYFEDGLLAWEANIDIHPILHYYKVLDCSRLVFSYLWISKDEAAS